MNHKLTGKQLAFSIFLFIIGYLALVSVFLLMTVMVQGEGVLSYLQNNVAGVVRMAVFVFMLTAISYCYLVFENSFILKSFSGTCEVFVVFITQLVLAEIVGYYVHPLARPFLFLPLIANALISRRGAIFITTVYCIMQFLVDKYLDILTLTEVESYLSMLVVYCAGLLSIFMSSRAKTRMQNVFTAVVVYVPTALVLVLFELPNITDFSQVGMLLLYGALSCIFSVVLFMTILPVFEFMFSSLTVYRLRELTSDDAKLIRMLKEQAVGTYHHSATVARLAEACAREIGEDAELARAAAYYHDVGKLKNPEMFTENQDAHNMHNELTPELSADIIRAHAKDGYALIKKAHLPEFFADVAVQHHGTLPIKYFYAKALKLSDGELNIQNYSYAGPTPTSKIAAIIMIADASEAATRSLANRSPENVEALVRSLIEERIDLDQFANCDITMKELTIIKTTIVDQLTGVYHSRIEYPKIKISKNK